MSYEFDAPIKTPKEFETLSYSHKREYVGYITEAKKEETRRTRIEKTVKMVKEKMKR